jgi:hypothetical protein
MRIRAGALVGLCAFALLAGAACGGSSSDGATPSSSSTPGPTLSSGVATRDYDAAIAKVKDRFGDCLERVQASTAGAKLAPAVTDPETGHRVPQDHRPVVVELSSGAQFLVELAPGGRDGASAFNRAADRMLHAATAKGGDCG